MYYKIIIALVLLSTYANAQNQSKYVLNMVRNNPGEPLKKSVFSNPSYLAQNILLAWL